jgi:hypothetical protein
MLRNCSRDLPSMPQTHGGLAEGESRMVPQMLSRDRAGVVARMTTLGEGFAYHAWHRLYWGSREGFFDCLASCILVYQFVAAQRIAPRANT